MERVIRVINGMEADGVIDNYAIGGGIAAIYYLEPYQTDDIDVFIPATAVDVGQADLISLEPIFDYLKGLGYVPSKEGVLIEGWLVQFIPTFESVQEEAISKALNVPFRRYGDQNILSRAPRCRTSAVWTAERSCESDRLDRGEKGRHGLPSRYHKAPQPDR